MRLILHAFEHTPLLNNVEEEFGNRSSFESQSVRVQANMADLNSVLAQGEKNDRCASSAFHNFRVVRTFKFSFCLSMAAGESESANAKCLDNNTRWHLRQAETEQGTEGGFKPSSTQVNSGAGSEGAEGEYQHQEPGFNPGSDPGSTQFEPTFNPGSTQVL